MNRHSTFNSAPISSPLIGPYLPEGAGARESLYHSSDAFGPRPHASHRAVFHRLGLSVSVAIALAGCETKTETMPQFVEADSAVAVRAWKDPKTGCEYLVISDDYPHKARAAITPRLRANGEPFCPAEGLQ